MRRKCGSPQSRSLGGGKRRNGFLVFFGFSSFSSMRMCLIYCQGEQGHGTFY